MRDDATHHTKESVKKDEGNREGSSLQTTKKSFNRKGDFIKKINSAFKETLCSILVAVV